MRQRLRLFVRFIAEAEKSYMWKRFLLADVRLAPVIAIVSDIDLRLHPIKSPTQVRL